MTPLLSAFNKLRAGRKESQAVAPPAPSTPAPAKTYLQGLASRLGTGVSPISSPAVQNFVKEAFVRTPVRLGVTGLAAAEDAARLATGKYDASTPERVTTGYDVPGFGQVKPFGAATGTSKENLKLPSAGKQGLEALAAGADIAGTITMGMAGPAKVAGAGVQAVSKVAKPVGIVERGVSKLASLGSRVIPKAKTPLAGLARVGIQATSDASVGAAQSVASDIARGDVTPEQIKKNAATSALFSALLPGAIAVGSGGIRGTARQVGQNRSFGQSAKNVLRTIGEEAGIVDVSAASKADMGNFGRTIRTKLYDREKELTTALEKLKAESKVPKFETVAGISGRTGPDEDLLKKISSTESQLKRTQQVRDLSTKWLDDRAPVMNNIALLRQNGMTEDGEKPLMDLTERSRVTDSVVTGDMLGRYERLEELRPQDIPQDFWRKKVDEYADLKTKLETTRDDVAGQMANQARLTQLEGEFAARGDDSLQRLKQAHQDVVVSKNMDELDKNVAAGLITPEEAARLKTENPNYSRLIALDYLDEDSTAKLFKTKKDASGPEWKARSEKARADFESLGATEANALAAYASEARRAKNVQLRGLVDANLEHGTDVFTPIITEADQLRKQALIKRQMELGDQKQELADAAKKKLQELRANRSGRNALETFRKGGKKDIVEDIARFEEGVSELKGQASAEVAEVRRQAAEAKQAIAAEKRINAERNKFAAAMRSTASNLKKGGTATAEEIANIRALAASRTGADVGTINELADSLERLSSDKQFGKGRVDAVRKVEGLMDKLSSDTSKRFSTMAQAEQAKVQSVMDNLAGQRSKLLEEMDGVSVERQQVAQELFAINAKAEAAGADAVRVKRNGVEEIYQVNDRQMADYIKGKEKQEATGVLKVINGAADWVRKFATGANPVFGLSNMIRDYNSAVTNVGNRIPMGVDDVMGNLAPAYTYVGRTGAKVDPKIKEVLRIGGPLTYISKEVKGGEASEIVDLFSSRKKNGSVLEGVSRANEASELATRLGVYDAAKRAGVTDEGELRDLMRDATVDFTKAGSTMREINKAVPFVNARLQGLRNTIRSIAKDPAGQYRKAQIYAIFPQLVVDGMNSRYGSLADKISVSDRQDFYTPIVGKYTDEEGNEQPTYLRIPKGTQQQFAGMVKELVEDDSPMTGKERAEDFMIGLIKMSPVNSVPQLGGSFFSTYNGLQTNKDYRGYSVYPEYLNKPEIPARQKKRTTTSKSVEAVTDFLSRATGGSDTKEGLLELSPAQVEFGIRTGIPGVGGQIVDTIDMFRNVAKTGSVQPENRATDSVAGNLARLPFSSYFVKDKALSAPEYVTERNVDTAKQLNITKGGVKESAMSKLSDIKKAGTKEERATIAATLSKDEKEAVVKELTKKSFVYGVEPGAPPAERAVQIYNAIKSASPEELPNVARQLKENNVVSKDTARYLAAYKAYVKIKELGTPEERRAVVESLDYGSKEALAEYVKGLGK